MTLDDLVARAAALAAGPGRAILGITGSPGAGKSTLVEALLRELPPERAPDTFDVGGYVALLRRIRADAEDVIYAPAFERDLEQPLAGAIAVPRAARLVLTEGNYLLVESGRWPEVAAQLDETWFCDPRPDVRLTQLVARHITFGKEPDRARAWVAAVDEPNARLVESTRRRADVVVPADVLEALTPA